MIDNKKLISICIPTYNAERFIGETLLSITHQTYANIEIIVGDNASTDNTENIVKEFQKKDTRIQYIKNSMNVGYAQNCNLLINASQGKYIGIYHSDDIYEPTMVEKEVAILDTYPELKGVFTYAQWINEKAQKIKSYNLENKEKKSLRVIDLNFFLLHILLKGGSLFCCPTSMIRKEVYEKLSGYNNSLKYIEDQDMWARIFTLGNIGMITEKLINYRIHQYQGSSYYKDISRNKISVVIAHIEEFLVNQGLYSQYEKILSIAKARDYLKMAIFAVQLKNYTLFVKRINLSRKTYKFNWQMISYLKKIRGTIDFSLLKFYILIMLQKTFFARWHYRLLKFYYSLKTK